MNIQTKTTVPQGMPTTVEDFLRWNEGREGKREFVRGRVVEMMINVTRNHARIAAMLLMALGRRLDLQSHDIGSADFAVETADGVRYPDLYVDRRDARSKGSDLAATDPILLAEVLSSSSYGRDFVEKLSDYKGLASLRHYLILSQGEPRVWLWTRDDDGDWDGPVESEGSDATLDLSGLNLSIPLSELYAGIESRS